MDIPSSLLCSGMIPIDVYGACNRDLCLSSKVQPTFFPCYLYSIKAFWVESRMTISSGAWWYGSPWKRHYCYPYYRLISAVCQLNLLFALYNCHNYFRCLPALWLRRFYRFALFVMVLDALLCFIWLPIRVKDTYGFQTAKGALLTTRKLP